MAPGSALLRRMVDRGRAHQPLIGAHRGDSSHAPENSLAAFQAALQAGAELIELDVRLTRDGMLAVIHDENLLRITGVAGVVSDMTMSQLRTLDAGRQRGSRWAGPGLPELGDVLQMVSGDIVVNIEVKGDASALPVLADRVIAHDMGERVIVSSFDAAVVRAASALQPPLLVGLLLNRPAEDPVDAARAAGADLVHMQHGIVTAAQVDALHGAGLAVLTWTVNDPREMRRVTQLGVDAILSDDPRLLREMVG